MRKKQNDTNGAACKKAEHDDCPYIKSFAGSRGGFSKEPLAAGGKNG
jgi:hypothetical protein